MAADRQVFNLKWGKREYRWDRGTIFIYLSSLIARSIKENDEIGFPKHLVTKYVTSKRVYNQFLNVLESLSDLQNMILFQVYLTF